MLEVLNFFLEYLGENLFPCPLQILEATHIPWLISLSIFKASSIRPILLTLPTLWFYFCLHLPLIRALVITLDPHRWFRIISPSQGQWINNFKSIWDLNLIWPWNIRKEILSSKGRIEFFFIEERLFQS